MNSTSFISARPASQGLWTATSHTYDPSCSKEKVQVVAISELLSKEDALKRASLESCKRGCSFVRPDTGVLSITRGRFASGPTCQVIGICQDGDVRAIGKKFRSSDVVESLFASVDLVDRLAAASGISFIPPDFLKEKIRKDGPYMKGALLYKQLYEGLSEMPGYNP